MYTNRKYLVSVSVFVAVLIATISLESALAVLSPDAERNLAISKASEWLTIEVTGSWQKRIGESQTEIVASAKVISVKRSASGLEAGDAVLIAYELDYAAHKAAYEKWEVKNRGNVGPGFPGLPAAVEAGKNYLAHVRKQTGDGLEGTVYTPVAERYSFEIITD